MKATVSVVTGALCASILFAAQSIAAETVTGSWTIRPSESPGKVHFGLIHEKGRNHSNHSADWPADAFQGLDLETRGKRDVQFAIARDAGRFDCEGYLNNGVGAGVFLFTPDANYTKKMRDLGFTGIDDYKQFAMATVDVSTEFARQMKVEKLDGLDTDKLIALRIFDVTPKYIHEMRGEGLPMRDVDKVIAFRVHNVTLAAIKAYQGMGIRSDEEQLIAMHVHGATPEWITQMRKHGYEKLDVDKLVAFRVHDVTPEYIAKMEKLGYGRPDPDQLVAMRVHDITPDYVEKMKSRGMKDLSIDKLIQLRVHGID